MDVIKAPNLRDAVILAFVFAVSFLTANAWNSFFNAILQTVKTEEIIRDYAIYAILVTVFLVILIYILRKIYV